MAELSPTSPLLKEAAVQKLADDLRAETLPDTILKHLKTLGLHLEDEVMGPKLALVFLHAGGLPTLIQHLEGSLTPAGTTDADATASAIHDAAVFPLCRVLQQDNATVSAELQSVPGVITTLTAVFCDASLKARYIAAAALAILAVSQPTECECMVKGGVVELVLKFYFDVAAWPELMGNAVDLAWVLLRTVPVAARHFEQAICAPEPVQAFAALVLVQVCPSSCILLVRCTVTLPCIAPCQRLDQEVHVNF
jgi:hypothetical protein